MKRTFVRPEITKYNLQVAEGQDAMAGECGSGSVPQFSGGGTINGCKTGNLPNVDFTVGCSDGSGPMPVNSCRTGYGVWVGSCQSGESAGT